MDIKRGASVGSRKAVAHSSASARESSFRRDIEGLRAVAILTVVLFHAKVPGFDGGYVGVDVFFVISGFLITGLLWREISSTGGIRLKRFYGARARRLLPASAFVGVVTGICSALLLPPLEARAVIGDGIASALYVGNYRFVLRGIDYLASYMPPSPFEHYWSLGVEEQFYLLWPALVLATGWSVRRIAHLRAGASTPMRGPFIVVLTLIAALSFTLSLAMTHVAASVAFFSLPTRAWELALGGLIAFTADRWTKLPVQYAAIAGWFGLILISLACILLNKTTPYPGTAALLPVLGTILVIGSGCTTVDQGCGRFLKIAPMLALGRLSYSWYLWHWPVLLLTPYVLGHPLGLVGRLVAAVASGGLAVLTMRYIEDPVRFNARLRRSPNKSLLLGGGVTGCAVLASAVLLVLVPVPVGHGTPVSTMTITVPPPPPTPVTADIRRYDDTVRSAFDQVQAAIAATDHQEAVPSNLVPNLADAAHENPRLYEGGCLRNFLEADQPECVAGNRASGTTIALVGDSNAAMWRPAFEQVAAKGHWRLETMAKAGCPLMDISFVNLVLRREYSECARWRDEVIARLRAEPPQLIIIGLWRKYGEQYGYTSGFTSYDSTWLENLNSLVKELRSSGSAVLVLGPIPDLSSVAPVCLSAHMDNPDACSKARITATNEDAIKDEGAAVASAGGQYLDITGLFCSDRQCPAIIGNNLVYMDKDHLTFEYVHQLAPALGSIVTRAIATGS